MRQTIVLACLTFLSVALGACTVDTSPVDDRECAANGDCLSGRCVDGYCQLSPPVPEPEPNPDPNPNPTPNPEPEVEPCEDEVCDPVPGATGECDEETGECVYECDEGLTDANEDLEEGDDGDGCECTPTADPTEICDGIDNDCNGDIDAEDDAFDEDESCPEGENVENACVEGECVFECEGGFVDLNDDLDNLSVEGEESDGCEYECTVTFGGEELCDGLDNDCNGLFDTEDSEFDIDEACPEGENVDNTCVATRCVFECEDEFADVNGDIDEGEEGDGCECEPDEPSTEICDGGDNDCDGAIDANDTDFTIETACEVLPGATASCVAGNCGYVCQNGFTDNNGDLEEGDEGDGCECGPIEICNNGEDDDCDGVIDNDDDCAEPDDDSDGIPNNLDNCPDAPNQGQEDNDNDGDGDACDDDDDSDGVLDVLDNCVLAANTNQLDSDNDLEGDACDTDDDNDGAPDTLDCAPLNDEIRPGNEEICNGIDDNCTEGADEGGICDLFDVGEGCLNDDQCTSDNCNNGFCAPEGMVTVRPGAFPMGCNSGDMGCQANEQPISNQTIPLYFIDRTESIQEVLIECIEESACNPAFSNLNGPSETVISAINFRGAQDVCEFQGKRLCSEAEWEKAARGPTGTTFAHGNGPIPACNRAIMCFNDPMSGQNNQCGCDAYAAPEAVPLLGASAVGAIGMTANVLEWTEDCWHDSHTGRPPAGDVWDFDCDSPDRVLKSADGGVDNGPDTGPSFRAASRQQGSPTAVIDGVGLRCCLSPDE